MLQEYLRIVNVAVAARTVDKLQTLAAGLPQVDAELGEPKVLG